MPVFLMNFKVCVEIWTKFTDVTVISFSFQSTTVVSITQVYRSTGAFGAFYHWGLIKVYYYIL